MIETPKLCFRSLSIPFPNLLTTMVRIDRSSFLPCEARRVLWAPFCMFIVAHIWLTQVSHLEPNKWHRGEWWLRHLVVQMHRTCKNLSALCDGRILVRWSQATTIAICILIQIVSSSCLEQLWSFYNYAASTKNNHLGIERVYDHVFISASMWMLYKSANAKENFFIE